MGNNSKLGCIKKTSRYRMRRENDKMTGVLGLNKCRKLLRTEHQSDRADATMLLMSERSLTIRLGPSMG